MGPTDVGNLHAKERFHRSLKTAGIWRSEPVDDDGLERTTTAGRRYVTGPKDWLPARADLIPSSTTIRTHLRPSDR